jgi:hypothetical protein
MHATVNFEYERGYHAFCDHTIAVCGTKVLKQWFGRVVPGDWTLADIYFMMVNGELDGQAVDKWPWDTRDKGVGNDDSIPDSVNPMVSWWPRHSPI